jgi:hypothetical protein
MWCPSLPYEVKEAISTSRLQVGGRVQSETFQQISLSLLHWLFEWYAISVNKVAFMLVIKSWRTAGKLWFTFRWVKKCFRIIKIKTKVMEFEVFNQFTFLHSVLKDVTAFLDFAGVVQSIKIIPSLHIRLSEGILVNINIFKVLYSFNVNWYW